MPAQQQKSGLLAGLGSQVVDAYNQARTTKSELKFGGQVPAGIENGIAELRDLTIGVYKEGTKYAGKPYFMAQAVMLFPKTHAGQKVEGLYTKCGPEALCDTSKPGDKLDGSAGRKTFQQHFKYMIDMLVQLGWKGKSLEGKSPEQVDAIVLNAFKALKAMKPKFRVRTWKGKKQVIAQGAGGFFLFDEDDAGNRKQVPGKGPYATEQIAKNKNPYAGNEPMVNHIWGELVVNWQKPANNDTTDQTGESVYDPNNRLGGNGERGEPAQSESFNPDDADGGDTSEERHTEQDFSASDDIDALVAAASEPVNDKSAQDRLEEMAVNAGWTAENVQAANSWADVAELINRPSLGGDEGNGGPEDVGDPGDEEKSEAAADPKVKDIVWYRPIDPKTKKPVRRPVECEVTAVDKRTERVSLQLKRDKKVTYPNVAWDKLEQSA